MNILITTAGGGNALNLARSLKYGFSYPIKIIGVNIDKFELAKAYYSENYDNVYLVPKFTEESYLPIMMKIIEDEEIDFVIPNHEFEIEYIINEGYNELLEKCFLPSMETVNLCNDKYGLNQFLGGYEFLNANLGSGISNVESVVPRSKILSGPLDQYKDYPYWVRLTKGAGSRGANIVHTIDDLYNWVEHWVANEDVDYKDFMISEYLPGVDHHYFSLWNKGEMVIGKAIKRMRYCCAKYSITGTSSSPSLCALVKDPILDEINENIIKAVDPHAQGLFGVDFKADKDGVHKITEINIGRFPRINYIFNLTPGGNLAKRYVEIGMGLLGLSDVGKTTDSQYPNDKYFLIRDFDTEPVLITKEDLDYMTR